jgi:hypothetical protein
MKQLIKQRLKAILTIFSSWILLDYFFHHIILIESYIATHQLWRSSTEMKLGLMYGISLITACFFVMIYCQIVSKKTMRNAIKLGLLIGLLVGAGSIGAYSYMPLPLNIPILWSLSAIVNFSIAGSIVGFFMKE